MWGDRIRPVAAGLLSRGFEPLPLEAGEREAFRRLGDVSARFFSAPDDILRRSQWSGEGSWAGYQPMPDGDPDVVDNIDRFEASHEMLSFPDDAWPWLSGPAHELRTALTAVDEVARRIVAASGRGDLRRRDPDPVRPGVIRRVLSLRTRSP